MLNIYGQRLLDGPDGAAFFLMIAAAIVAMIAAVLLAMFAAFALSGRFDSFQLSFASRFTLAALAICAAVVLWFAATWAFALGGLFFPGVSA